MKIKDKKRISIFTLILIVSINIFSISAFANIDDQYTQNLCIKPANASASTNFQNRNAAYAFDKSNASFENTWQNNSTMPAWLQYTFDEPKKIELYTLQSMAHDNGSYAPLKWTFEASNTGSPNDWTILQTVDNEKTWGNNETREYYFNNDKKYIMYRISITQGQNTNSYVRVAEMQMMEKSAPISPLVLQGTLENASTKLTWTSNSNEISYNVKRSLTASGPYVVIASNVKELNYLDSSLEAGKTYYYVVSPTTSAGEGANSNEVSVTTDQIKPDDSTKTSKAIIEITLNNGKVKEYEVTATELAKYQDWFDRASEGTGKKYYTFVKTVLVKPFVTRKETIQFKDIETFEVKEY